MTGSTPSKKAVPPSYQGALANLRPMMDAADRTGAAGYYAVGRGIMECRALGAKLAEIASAIGRSKSAACKIVQAMGLFPTEPQTADECRRFMVA